MDRRCMDCSNFDLKNSPLGKLGFGLCAVHSMTDGHTFSCVRPRVCEAFSPAPAATVALRERLIGPMEQEAP